MPWFRSKPILKHFLNRGDCLNIGLIDVDSHKFPNLCLVKISYYHKSKGNHVEWYNKNSHYDIVYKSKVFTDEYSKDTYSDINADEFITGGTGYNLENKLSIEIEHSMQIIVYTIIQNFKILHMVFLQEDALDGVFFVLYLKKKVEKVLKFQNCLNFGTDKKTSVF